MRFLAQLKVRIKRSRVDGVIFKVAESSDTHVEGVIGRPISWLKGWVGGLGADVGLHR
jgi:hypothetical protein